MFITFGRTSLVDYIKLKRRKQYIDDEIVRYVFVYLELAILKHGQMNEFFHDVSSYSQTDNTNPKQQP